ncbi:MAG: hypothetical protein KF744_16975 [Taibaiella sp.]|nr:hypothetical protein [Taibaiella sp.]
MKHSARYGTIIAAIGIITFFCFRYTLGNQFTLWDDDYYVTNNQYIRAFTAENLKVLFTQDITKNNYHPLCLLSLAVNYHFAGLEPWSYYLTNIVIHIANAVLVFFLFLRLCRKLDLNSQSIAFVSGFGALWFAIHPMHVESVAWIAERKDVLYAFFYLLGLLSYCSYLEAGHRRWYWISFFLFVLSCLSKPMAVVFPLSLICLDLFYGLPLNKRMVLNKTIFFVGSLLCGGFAFYSQNRAGAVASFGALTIGERILYASYGFIMYVWKLLVPTNLSTLYPYPYRYISGYLPAIYYLAPFIALVILLLPTWILYKRRSSFFKIHLFGMGFFLANVIFVLQFVSVGSAIMSDRYSYVAYIGLLFLVAYGLNAAIQKWPAAKVGILGLSLLFSTALAALCAQRTHVWHDSETLLTDAIEKYPYRALLSYKWRGNYYMSIGEFDKAMKDYELLASIRAADDKVKANMERITAMKIMQSGGASPMEPSQNASDSQEFKSSIDSAIFFAAKGDTVAAFRKYVHALAANASLAERTLAVSSNELVQTQHYRQAIVQYNMLTKINTTNPFYYFLRGCALFGVGEMQSAIIDWERAAKMNSKDVQQSSNYNLSVAYDSLHNPQMAWKYLSRSMELGYNASPEFVDKLKKRYEASLR